MNAETKAVTVNAIMMSVCFKTGYSDAMRGKFDPDQYGDPRDQWRYERGWQFARALKHCKPEMAVAKMPLENRRSIRIDYRREFKAQRNAENIL